MEGEQRELSPEEILEAKKEEIKKNLEEITDAFLENAESEELKGREEAQKRLSEFLENEETSDDEKALTDAMRIRNGLGHRDWAKSGFSEDNDGMADFDHSGELSAQFEKVNMLKDKFSEEKFGEIEHLVSKAFLEYWDKQYEWEKEK